MAIAASQPMYVEFLEKKGYAPKVDESGPVIFDIDEETYVLTTSDELPGLVMLHRLITDLETDEEMVVAVHVANAVNGEVTCAKVYIDEERTVTASVELIVDPPEAFMAIFDRAIGALDVAVDMFENFLMSEEGDEGDGEEEDGEDDEDGAEEDK